LSATKEISPGALALWESIGIFLALYVIEICAGLITIVFLGWDHEGFGDPALTAKIIFLGQIGTIAAAYVAKQKLGWNYRPWFKSFTLGPEEFLRVVKSLALVLIVTFSWSQLHSLIAGPTDNSNALIDSGILSDNRFTLITFMFTVVVVGPIAEEIAFRGLMLDRLERQFKAKTANMVQAFLFAAAHLNAESFLPLFAIGYVAGRLRQTQGCLSQPVLLHCLNNALYVAALFASA